MNRLILFRPNAIKTKANEFSYLLNSDWKELSLIGFSKYENIDFVFYGLWGMKEQNNPFPDSCSFKKDGNLERQTTKK